MLAPEQSTITKLNKSSIDRWAALVQESHGKKVH